MNIGKACAIFKQIESDKYTDIEKLIAIDSVLNMETHNGVTKDEILRAFKWFLESEVPVTQNNSILASERLPEPWKGE